MAAKIRLKQVGKRSQHTFRIVVIEGSKPQDGRVLEEIGHFDPHTDELRVDEARALDWLSKGVQPSPSAKRLLTRAGVQQDKDVRTGASA
mgnify:FL=1